MARLYSRLVLFATIYCMKIHCSKRTRKLMYKPYGPNMCRELCHDSRDAYYFQEEELSCHRVSHRNSIRRHEKTAPWTLACGQDVFETAQRVSPPTEDENVTHHINWTSTLHQACEKGNLGMVKWILFQNRTDINVKGKLERSPVMTAAANGRKAVFDFLVRQDCDLFVVDETGDTVLHVACEGGNVDIVRKLVRNFKQDIECKGRHEWTPVMTSVFCGRIQVFDFLVNQHCNAKILDNRMRNILHVACSGGYVDMVKHVLNTQEIVIESRDIDGWTPVMTAAFKGHVPVVEFLLDTGCTMVDVDSKGYNILHVACRGGHLNMVRYIIDQHKHSIDSRGGKERTPVMVAARSGHIDVVKLLVDNHCKLELLDAKRFNILHMAGMGGNVNVMKFILTRVKFDLDSRGWTGRTPLWYAAYHGHLAMFIFLEGKGCNLSYPDNKRNNILHVACRGGNVDMVKYILSKGKFGIDSKSEYGVTPVLFAVYKGHKNVLNFLISEGCDLQITDLFGNNILHMACGSGNVNIVKYIFTHQEIGTEQFMERKNKRGWTPVMTAADQGHKKIVMFLASKGSKLNTLDTEGKNILHLTCSRGHTQMVKYILSLGTIGIDSVTKMGETPAMIAVNCGHMATVKYLLGKGCSVKHFRGNNLLQSACGGGHVDMVKYILSLPEFDVESKGHLARTPVMISAFYGKIDVAKFLVKEGCDLKVVDSEGSSILHIAILGGQTDMVKYLMTFKVIRMKKGERNTFGTTPLQLAKSKGYTEIVALLNSLV